MRVCKSCGTEKQITAFPPYKTDKGSGRRHKCYACRSKANRNYVRTKASLQNTSVCQYLRNGSFSGMLRLVLNQCKRNAQRRNIPFDISKSGLEKVYTAQGGKCAITGMSLSPHNNGIPGTGTSVDRIDNRIGYELHNVRLVVPWANMARGELTDDEFVNFCKMVVDHARA